MRWLCLVAVCAMVVSPAHALKVGDGAPVSGASMGGADGAVEVAVNASKAIIDWSTMDTAAGELLKFVGADGYAVLNRVTGKKTEFMGNLEAFGGHIIIVNANGIVFGPQSLLQAAQLTASSLRIDQQDFLDGNLKFTAVGETFGEVINEGTIIAKEQAALIAQRVINKGTIVCEEGAILMATGDKVVLGSPGSTIVVEITGVKPFAGINNAGQVMNSSTGQLDAAGDIVLAAGDIFAQSLAVGNIGRVENRGTITTAGDLEAAALDETVFRAGSDIQAAGDIRLKGGKAVTIEADLASGEDMTIKSGGMVKTRKADLASGGAMHITSGTANSIGVDGGITSGGDMVLQAGTFIAVKDDLVSGGDMTITTNSDKTYSMANLLAEGDINLRTELELSGGQWVRDGSGNMVYEGQRIEARTGTLTAEGLIWKITPGELHLYGGSEDLAVDIQGGVLTGGNMYISGEGDIQVSNYLIAIYPTWWMPSPPPGEDFYVMPHAMGGVSVISKSGSIYTRGTDGLNIPIAGYSNDLGGWWDVEDYIAGGAGVDLPYKSPEGDSLGKAAIVLQSKDTLKLGEDALLLATGYYLPAGAIDEGPAGVDDRPGVDLLPYDAKIGGYDREKGVPSDVAIYAGSTGGNVDVATPALVVIEGMPFFFSHSEYSPEPVLGPATVVLDAYDTVSFSGLMKDYLAYKYQLYTDPEGPYEGKCFEDYIGRYRMEVSSRKTEWLSQAIAWGTLPYADEPEFMQWLLHGEDYVLRGGGGSNFPAGHRAWVLEDLDVPPVAPLAHFEFPEFKGCPAELAAAANELGVTADRFQMLIGASLAMNPNIHACNSCAKLLRAATILNDSDGAHMAAMNLVFNQFAPADAPFTPETAAAIMMAFAELSGQSGDYALASAYVDAYVQYVGALGELGSPVGDSVMYVMDKHGKALMESANSNMAAYVAAMLENVGG